MKQATIIGIDLAKNVFQIHGSDKAGNKLFSKKLSRGKILPFFSNHPVSVVAMEACASSHYWGRKFAAMGHEVRLIAPQFVKPFVKSNKNDRNDAEAIVEAASRPSMRFVAVKTIEQQSVLCLHRVRSRLVGNRTALINEIRGLLGEFGLVVAQGPSKLKRELPLILSQSVLSESSRRLFGRLQDELVKMESEIGKYDREIKLIASSNELPKRLMQVPGVGPLTATALIASVGSATSFASGRELSAWLGLVPRQNSSGGKENLGRISKRGDGYVRKLLVHGARSALLRVDARDDEQSCWLKKLVERRGRNRAIVALANKNARILWAMMRSGQDYRVA